MDSTLLLFQEYIHLARSSFKCSFECKVKLQKAQLTCKNGSSIRYSFECKVKPQASQLKW